MPQRVVLRTIFPDAGSGSLLPLYVEQQRDEVPVTVTGRHAVQVAPGARASLLSYFNAFPAAYWQHNSTLSSVRLEVRAAGSGSVHVRASDEHGRHRTVRTLQIDGTQAGATAELPLEDFETGGWYWIEVVAGEAGFELQSAEWCAPIDATGPAGVSVVVTTHNRPDFCARLIAALGADAAVAEAIDRVFVVDQGTRKVRDEPDFAELVAVHGERLVMIDQENLGGSGGFSRGMLELLRRNESGYLLLLDDDIMLEPEGVLRALQFARYTSRPTIVGGHMLDLNAPLILHAFGEVVDPSTFNWGPPDPEHRRHDFGVATLGETGWLHHRAEVDFNGWWMCLLPREAIDALGLALPFFIKWDDAEYGLRAQEHGIPTVSLPGAAVWHVSWLDKDDSRDWQSYFHSRNRLISALLHSPRRFGGTVIRESFGLDLKHLMFLQYYAVRLRHEALRDLLRGPGMLEGTMRTRLPWARAVAADYDEMGAVSDDLAASPATADPRTSTPRPAGLGLIAWLGRNVPRHFLPVRNRRTAPARLTRSEARWWRVPSFDAVQVPLADGSGTATFRRNPHRFRAGLRESVVLHARVLVSWRRLRRQYRAAAADLSSAAAWEGYLGLSASGAPAPRRGTASLAASSSREMRSS